MGGGVRNQNLQCLWTRSLLRLRFFCHALPGALLLWCRDLLSTDHVPEFPYWPRRAAVLDLDLQIDPCNGDRQRRRWIPRYQFSRHVFFRGGLNLHFGREVLYEHQLESDPNTGKYLVLVADIACPPACLDLSHNPGIWFVRLQDKPQQGMRLERGFNYGIHGIIHVLVFFPAMDPSATHALTKNMIFAPVQSQTQLSAWSESTLGSLAPPSENLVFTVCRYRHDTSDVTERRSAVSVPLGK